MNKYKTQLLLMEIETMKEELENPEYIDMEKIKKDKIEYQKTHPDVKPSNLSTGWTWYIIVMVGGLIFKCYPIIAVIATFYFISWRHDEIEKANGRKYDD